MLKTVKFQFLNFSEVHLFLIFSNRQNKILNASNKPSKTFPKIPSNQALGRRKFRGGYPCGGFANEAGNIFLKTINYLKF